MKIFTSRVKSIRMRKPLIGFLSFCALGLFQCAGQMEANDEPDNSDNNGSMMESSESGSNTTPQSTDETNDPFAPCTDKNSDCSVEISCSGNPDQNVECHASGLWDCDQAGKCKHKTPMPNGDTDWQCTWASDRYSCDKAGESCNGLQPADWSCSYNKAKKNCECTHNEVPNPTNKPEGTQGWSCTIETGNSTVIVCERIISKPDDQTPGEENNCNNDTPPQTTCCNQCSPHEKKCNGNGYQTCLQTSQSCWVWSAVTSCNQLEHCQSGTCVKVQCPHQATLAIRSTHRAHAGTFLDSASVHQDCDPGYVMTGMHVNTSGGGGGNVGNLEIHCERIDSIFSCGTLQTLMVRGSHRADAGTASGPAVDQSCGPGRFMTGVHLNFSGAGGVSLGNMEIHCEDVQSIVSPIGQMFSVINDGTRRADGGLDSGESVHRDCDSGRAMTGVHLNYSGASGNKKGNLELRCEGFKAF